MKSYLLMVYAINAKLADVNFHYIECEMTKL